jgi:hypothetical protein
LVLIAAALLVLAVLVLLLLLLATLILVSALLGPEFVFVLIVHLDLHCQHDC